jgi:hypothetical protein
MIVDAPDGKSIDFPDSMSKEQVTSAMQRLYPPTQKEPQNPIDAAFPKTSDAVMGLGTGLARGTIDTALAPVDVGAWLTNKGTDIFSGRDSSQDATAPSTALESKLGLDYKTKTGLGETAQVTGELAPIGATAGKLVYEGGKAALKKGGGYIGKKLAGDVSTITSQDIKNVARAGYEAAPTLGSQLKPDYVGKIFSAMEGPAPTNAWEKVAAARDPIRKVLSEYEEAKGSAMGVSDFEGFDQYLTDKISQEFKNGLSQDGQRLFDAQSKMREMVYNPAEEDIVGGKEGFEAYRQATKAWSDAKKLQDIETIFKRAESSDNAATAIRNGFKALYNSPSRMRGYTEEQKAIIKDAATSSLPLEYLRTMGSRLLSIGEMVSGHPIGAVLSPVISAGAREGQALMQARRAQPLIKSITDPYKGQVPPAQTPP